MDCDSKNFPVPWMPTKGPASHRFIYVWDLEKNGVQWLLTCCLQNSQSSQHCQWLHLQWCDSRGSKGCCENEHYISLGCLLRTGFENIAWHEKRSNDKWHAHLSLSLFLSLKSQKRCDPYHWSKHTLSQSPAKWQAVVKYTVFTASAVKHRIYHGGWYALSTK